MGVQNSVRERGSVGLSQQGQSFAEKVLIYSSFQTTDKGKGDGPKEPSYVDSVVVNGDGGEVFQQSFSAHSLRPYHNPHLHEIKGKSQQQTRNAPIKARKLTTITEDL